MTSYNTMDRKATPSADTQMAHFRTIVAYTHRCGGDPIQGIYLLKIGICLISLFYSITFLLQQASSQLLYINFSTLTGVTCAQLAIHSFSLQWNDSKYS